MTLVLTISAFMLCFLLVLLLLSIANGGGAPNFETGEAGLTVYPSTTPTSSPTFSNNLVIQVDYSNDDMFADANQCFPTSTGFCSIRSAVEACGIIANTSSNYTKCIVEIPQNDLIYINKTYGSLNMTQEHNIEINGNDAFVEYVGGTAPPQWEPVGKPFPVTTGSLSNTNSAMQNYVRICTEACHGDILEFSACGADQDQDTYFRLYDGVTNTSLAKNDDSCGVASKLEYEVTSLSCSSFCLHVGCWGTSTCETTVEASILRSTLPPAEIIGNGFPFVTGNLTNTSSAMQNYAELCVTACYGDQFTFTSCDGSPVYGDTYFRLFDTSGSELASNDDACGSASALAYTAIAVGCNDICLHIGCYSASNCSATVDGYVIASTAPNTTELNGAFPFVTGMMNNTDNAQNNTSVACLEACQGVILTFSSCGGSSTEDSYLRLYNWLGFEVSSNDDACGSASEISYEVTAFGCNQYCLHMGCSSDVSCSYIVEAYTSPVLAQPRFIFFQNTNSSEVTLRPPLLTINDLALRLFGSASVNGGSIFIDGYVNVELNNVWVGDSSGLYGGAIYVNNNHPGVFNMHNVTLYNCIAGNGGGLYIDRNVSSFLMLDSTISYCSATETVGEQYGGGGIYINEYNEGVTLTNVTISNCDSLDNGGGIMLYQFNPFFTVQNSRFLSNEANLYGGCLFAYRYNEYVVLESNLFANCVSYSRGGAIGLYNDNNNPQVLDSNFIDCSANEYGGALFTFQNSQVVISGSYFFRVGAGTLGGVLFAGHNGTGVLLDRCVFDESYAYHGEFRACLPHCSPFPQRLAFYVSLHRCAYDLHSQLYVGGVVYVGTATTGFICTNSLFNNTSCPGYGGNILMYGLNPNSTIKNVDILNCQTTAHIGGGISVGDDCPNLLLSNVTIRGCNAYQGGGLHLDTGNHNVTLIDSEIKDCHATSSYGGAIRIFQSNSDFHVINTLFELNGAEEYGGAIASDSNNPGMIIAGCEFINNTAGLDGGAIYVVTTHPQFVITDLSGYSGIAVVQSEHPYQSAFPDGDGNPYIIMSQTVTASSAEIVGFLLNFNEDTKINSLDELYIYTDSSKTELLFSTNKLYPGSNIPSMRIAGSSFYVEFTGNTERYYPTTYSQDYYGFTLYAYPIAQKDSLDKTLFANNTAGGKGGAVFMYYNNLFPVFLNIDVVGNDAQNGGGMYFRNMNTGAAFQDVSFVGNTAQIEGGALVFSSTHFGSTVYNVSFRNNLVSEGRGGAVSIVTDNGNGVLLKDNQIHFASCAFENNKASNGGALYMNDDNTIVLESVAMWNNSASIGEGGAIACNDLNAVSIVDSSIVNNFAFLSGGAVASNQDNDFELNGALIANNYAHSTGGGISLMDQSTIVFSGVNTIVGNTAYLAGGGIACRRSPLWTLDSSSSSLSIVNNTAPRGSAVFFDALVASGNEFHDILIAGNNATVGGTVFWLYNDSMSVEPPGLNTSSVVWSNNHVQYGPKVATQAVVMEGPDVYDVEVYSSVLTPPLVFKLYDYYSQFIPLEGTTSISASVPLPVTDHSNCSVYPYLAGADMFGGGVAMANGSATFAALNAYCSPSGTLVVQFEAKLGDLMGMNDLVAGQYYLRNTTTFSFRNCVAGEYESNGECLFCPYGSYSLESGQPCTSCFSVNGISECWGNQIVILDGYWRRFETSSVVLKCPLEARSCTGGNNTGVSLCGTGYTGEMCAVCESGYFLNENRCTECTAAQMMTPTLVVYVIAAGLMVLMSVYSMLIYYKVIRLEALEASAVYVERNSDMRGVEMGEMAPSGTPTPPTQSPKARIGKRKSKTLSSDSNSSDEVAVKQRPLSVDAIAVDEAGQFVGHEIPDYIRTYTKFQRVKIWLKQNYSRIVPKVKIVVATFQIVSEVAYVLDVEMPSIFLHFVNSVSIININVASAFPLNCSGRVDFIERLYLVTLAPLIYILLLFILFVRSYIQARKKLKVKRRRIPGDALRKFNQIRSQYVSYFFLLTYLVLPSVTTTIFQMFICTDVDPNNEDPGQNDLFLTADMSISCTSTYYYDGVIYASVMILLYPIGVPCLYYYLLYCGRSELKHRDDKPQEEKEVENDTVNPLNGGLVGSRVKSVSSDGSITTSKARSAEKLSVGVARINFLWQAYQPKYWYWEVIETTRRLMMTAVLSVCAPGTTGQAVFAVVLSVIYIKLYSLCGPYTSTVDNVLAETGQFQIYCTFFGALIVQGVLLGNKWNNALGVLLVLINLSVFAYILKVEYDVYHETKDNEIREEETEMECDSDEEDMYSLSVTEVEKAYVHNNRTCHVKDLPIESPSNAEEQTARKVSIEEPKSHIGVSPESNTVSDVV